MGKKRLVSSNSLTERIAWERSRFCPQFIRNFIKYFTKYFTFAFCLYLCDLPSHFSVYINHMNECLNKCVRARSAHSCMYVCRLLNIAEFYPNIQTNGFYFIYLFPFNHQKHRIRTINQLPLKCMHQAHTMIPLLVKPSQVYPRKVIHIRMKEASQIIW